VKPKKRPRSGASVVNILQNQRFMFIPPPLIPLKAFFSARTGSWYRFRAVKIVQIATLKTIRVENVHI